MVGKLIGQDTVYAMTKNQLVCRMIFQNNHTTSYIRTTAPILITTSDFTKDEMPTCDFVVVAVQALCLGRNESVSQTMQLGV